MNVLVSLLKTQSKLLLTEAERTGFKSAEKVWKIVGNRSQDW